MEPLLEAIREHFVFTVIGVCFVTAITMKAMILMVAGNGRERSRREIAAYIAEGSISPEEGERLLRAKVSGGEHA